MKRTLIVLLDCLILAGVLPGCGTAIMGIVEIIEPGADARIEPGGFVKVIPSVADRDPAQLPPAIEPCERDGPEPAPAGAIAQAMASPEPAATTPPEPGPPVLAASTAGPADLAGLAPEWDVPLLPEVKATTGPVERSVAAPGGTLDAAVKALVAKLGKVKILKTTVHNESGDPARLVALYNINHRELLVIDPLDYEGRVSPKALALFEHLLRSVRTDETHPIDPVLVKLLHAVALAHDGVLMVSSGFREPGHGTKPTSYHTKGMAADVRHPYLPAKAIADFAREWGAGGVGYYPKTHFVHLDVRETPFHWIDYSAKGEKGKVIPDPDGLLADIAAAKWEGVESPFFNAATEPALDPSEIGMNGDIELVLEPDEDNPADESVGASLQEDLPEV